MRSGKMGLMVTGGVILFLYLPILMLFISSFNPSRFAGSCCAFSLKWYQRLWEEREMWNALWNSLLIATGASLSATFLGSIAATALHFYRSRWQKLHYALIYAPLVIPDILMGISLLLFFVFLNLPLGLFTIYLVHTTFCLSYVTFLMLSKWQSIDLSIIEAAQDLGGNTSTILRQVLFPLLKPGLMASLLLSFTLSIDDFVITYFVAGPGATTLPLYVYSMIKFGSTPIINALSSLILLITFCTIYFSQSLARKTFGDKIAHD